MKLRPIQQLAYAALQQTPGLTLAAINRAVGRSPDRSDKTLKTLIGMGSRGILRREQTIDRVRFPGLGHSYRYYLAGDPANGTGQQGP
jgi:hypothetical protein